MGSHASASRRPRRRNEISIPAGVRLARGRTGAYGLKALSVAVAVILTRSSSWPNGTDAQVERRADRGKPPGKRRDGAIEQDDRRASGHGSRGELFLAAEPAQQARQTIGIARYEIAMREGEDFPGAVGALDHSERLLAEPTIESPVGGLGATRAALRRAGTGRSHLLAVRSMVALLQRLHDASVYAGYRLRGRCALRRVALGREALPKHQRPDDDHDQRERNDQRQGALGLLAHRAEHRPARRPAA